MKKQMVNLLLLLFVFFIAFIPFLYNTSQYKQGSSSSMQVLSTNDLITNSAALIVSAPYIYHKWQSKPLFTTSHFQDHIVEYSLLEGISRAVFSSDSSSFLYFVMYHSNYLS